MQITDQNHPMRNGLEHLHCRSLIDSGQWENSTMGELDNWESSGKAERKLALQAAIQTNGKGQNMLKVGQPVESIFLFTVF